MRGKGADACRCGDAGGITPACAGKRALLLQSTPSGRDHPRVCGEKQASSCTAQSLLGSPPRVRGKALRTLKRGFAIRITPAYAGKRNGRCSCSTAGRDHPRVCGEKTSSRQSTSCCRGSPPRVRGKDIKQAIHIMLQRITPACAGKRAASAREAYFIWDHPRVCGEKPIPANNGKTIEGSPPRMWGKAPVLPA